jgi:hypothetical protein
LARVVEPRWNDDDLLDRVALFGVHRENMDMSQTTRISNPTEVLAGLVDRVTFQNSENGFCVLRIKARGQRDLITLVGHAAMISAGEFVQASGSWINRPTKARSSRLPRRRRLRRSRNISAPG